MTAVSVRNVSLSYNAHSVLRDISLEIEEGEFLVLLGPSGCGKSTLLDCIAGLNDIDSGQIFIDNKNVTWAEPAARGIGMVFQSYALYPQMSVEKNLSFGLRNARMAGAEIKKRVARAAEILQIEPLLKRKPAALSGGQRQRVAIGRALVRDVGVFLFDEPLSNLDAKLRAELRVEIKRLHQQIKNTMVYVTHDQIEALTLADRIAVMREGVIQQLDIPLTIYENPINKFVAEFIGSPSMNFLYGNIHIEEDETSFRFDDQTLSLAGYPAKKCPASGSEVVLGIRPEHIAVDSADGSRNNHAAGKPPIQILATFEIDEPMGADSLAWFKVTSGQRLSARVAAKERLPMGAPVTLSFASDHISLFLKADGNRI